MSEVEAIRRLQAGDRSALEPIYSTYASTAIRTAFLITRNRAAAEDAVQESFVQVIRSVTTLRDPCSFRPWFYQIVVNAAKRSARMAARTLPLSQSPDERVDLTASSPDDEVLGAEEKQQVRSALEALPGKHRDILILRYYTDLSEAEIAQALGLLPGTVKSRLHRAREALSARLEGATLRGIRLP